MIWKEANTCTHIYIQHVHARAAIFVYNVRVDNWRYPNSRSAVNSKSSHAYTFVRSNVLSRMERRHTTGVRCIRLSLPLSLSLSLPFSLSFSTTSLSQYKGGSIDTNIYVTSYHRTLLLALSLSLTVTEFMSHESNPCPHDSYTRRPDEFFTRALSRRRASYVSFIIPRRFVRISAICDKDRRFWRHRFQCVHESMTSRVTRKLRSFLRQQTRA